jgi:hypothetical protein
MRHYGHILQNIFISLWLEKMAQNTLLHPLAVEEIWRGKKGVVYFKTLCGI